MRTTRVIAFSILAGIALGAGLVEALHAQGKPQAYVVGEISVTDPEGFAKEFSPLARKALAEAPGYRALVLGGKTVAIEGPAPKTRVVINDQNMPGLLRKNYWMSEDGLRVGGIYLWTSRADADRVFTPEWKKFVESKYGVPPVIEYLYSPVMVDNREGTISVAAA